MRTPILIACALLSACAAKQTAWTSLDPPDLPDDGDALVLLDNAALHLTRVQYADGHVQGRVVHAWSLPAAGVVAVGDDTRTQSPEDIARRAGWPELHLAAAWVDVPEFAIKSARGAVVPEPDEPSENESDHAVLRGIAVAVFDVIFDPRCCCHRR